MKSVITRCEECNIPGFQKINDVEAKATNMYNTKLRHGGQIMQVTLSTQAQTKLQVKVTLSTHVLRHNNESYTAHSGTNKITRGGGGGGGIMHQPLALRKWELLCEQLAFEPCHHYDSLMDFLCRHSDQEHCIS